MEDYPPTNYLLVMGFEPFGPLSETTQLPTILQSWTWNHVLLKGRWAKPVSNGANYAQLERGHHQFYLLLGIWVVVKIVVPFWVLSMMRHLVFRGPKTGP